MNLRIFFVALFSTILVACNQQNKTESDLVGLDETEAALSGQLEELKFQYTAYSNDFELFAEADAFVIGETANVLSHFSILPDFKAVEMGTIKLVLTVNGKETVQTLEKPTRKGIYSFDIKPETSGSGSLKFEITNEKGSFEVLVPEIIVFATHDEAHETAEKIVISRTNTTVFTKEQSWKIDFATGYPVILPFGQVIKTTAQIQSAQGDEVIISAKTNGIVMLSNKSVLQGNTVAKGQILCTISGSGFADNNATVRYAEAKNNYEKAKSDYERANELAKDKIVSEKDLLTAKNQYDNTKAIFDNLSENFSTTGQNISSPINGFVKQLYVQNGSYVEAGQPILTVTQNKLLLLYAEVQQKYASILGSIFSANIRTLHDNLTYTLEQLNGKVLTYGKTTNSDNYLIPVTFQIDNSGSFISGGFVEIFIKTITNNQALTILNSALLEEQGVFYVYVQVNPELFEKREVKIGGTDGLNTEILNGITAKDRIVTKGTMMIKLAQATGTLDAHSGHVH